MNRLQKEAMASIGRNDPCSCGSGKKYKKCCGMNEAETALIQEQNLILQSMLQEFFDNHPRPSQQKSLLDWKDKTQDLLVPLYGEDKSASIIGDVYFFSEHADIWNDFIEQKIQREIRTQILQVLQSWIDPIFLAGEILSITNYRAEMRDLLSGQEYTIDVNESFPVEAGNVAIGFYLPDLRINQNFLMALNSLTIAVDVTSDTIEKLKGMYRSSEAEQVQRFYKENIFPVYQIFSSGLRSAHAASEDALASIKELEQFFIEQDLKSDELIESFYHYLESLEMVPGSAVAGAVQFGIHCGLIQLDWPTEKLAQAFGTEQPEILSFAKELERYYHSKTASQEKEAEYAFEVGTNPKANELQNWQLFMHLKNATITSEAALKRQMEFYHAKPYMPKTDSEKAQLLAYQVYAEEFSNSRRDGVLEIQRLDSTLTDGYLLAAELESDTKHQKNLLEKAIISGKSQFEADMEVPWLYIMNRPYLRAKFLLGIHLWEQRNFEDAFHEFRSLLHLNPGDHQGARYLAISCLVALDRPKEAESLMVHYEDAYSDNAFYAWFKWLIQRNRSVHSTTTQELYLQALELNPYVKKYIEKRTAASPYPKKMVLSPRSPEEARLIWSFLSPALL